MTSVPPLDKVSISNIGGVFQGHVPLRTRAFEAWPKEVPFDCLHCGSSCKDATPIPAVKFFEPQLNVFWVYGPFCRSSCAFGFIAEHEASSASKQLALTAHVLRNQFGVHVIHMAPPRSAHKRQGGPLDDLEFHQFSERGVREVLVPPFVSFAQQVVANQKSGVDITKSADTNILPQSAGRFIDLTRPAERDFNLLERKPTQRAPMLLNWIAEMAPELLTKKETSIPKLSEDNLIEGSSRGKSRVASAATTTLEPKGFLTRQMKQ